MAYYEAVAEAAKIAEKKTKLFREALQEKAERRAAALAPTPPAPSGLVDAVRVNIAGGYWWEPYEPAPDPDVSFGLLKAPDGSSVAGGMTRPQAVAFAATLSGQQGGAVPAGDLRPGLEEADRLLGNEVALRHGRVGNYNSSRGHAQYDQAVYDNIIIHNALERARLAEQPAPAIPTDAEFKRLGWAPGSYEFICASCGLVREGDKRATCCESCATTRWNAEQPAPAGTGADGVEGLSQAAQDVLAERCRQVETEGWTPEHDDKHVSGEMAAAAMCYVQAALCELGNPRSPLRGTPGFWPWDPSWWKPTTSRTDLIKAGALILAEIDRLDRRAALDAGSSEEGRS